MKKVGMLLMWLLAGFMAIGALVYAPSLSSGILLLCAVLAAPIRPLQELFASKKIKGAAKGGILTVLFLAACAIAPTDRVNDRSAGAEPSLSIQTVDTSSPTVRSTPSPSETANVPPALSQTPAPEASTSPSQSPISETPSSSSQTPNQEASASPPQASASETPPSSSQTPKQEASASPSQTSASETPPSSSQTPKQEASASPSQTSAPETPPSSSQTPKQEASASPSQTSAPETPPASSQTPTGNGVGNSSNGERTGDASKFDTWNNPAQQQTTATWVLNTSTKKIHYPSCSSVKKIAPQNYSTSNLSESELIAQGYTVCKRCH